jgi:ornithine cyclodeaminase/alanine dehydrogenase-like protein (mu-crystallin family)
MTSGVLLLSEKEIERLLTRALCREVMAEAFRDFAAGRVSAPSKVPFAFEAGPLIVGPAHLPERQAFGLKLATIRPANREAGLPSAFIYVPLFDAPSGRLIALLGGNTLTTLRTAATSAVASRALARPDSRVLGIVGPGTQGREHAYALADVFPLEAMHVAGGRPETRARLVAELARDFPERVAAASIEEATRAADILVTATRATAPLVRRAWVRPGTHINAIGADSREEQELDPAILGEARIFVDSLDQCLDRGEVHRPIEQGTLSPGAIAGGLGDVLLGRVAGRRAPDEITVFDSTGVYFQDVALAKRLYDLARAQGLGRWVEI